LEEIPIHPASFRNDIIAASRLESDSDTDESAPDGEPTENSPLLHKSNSAPTVPAGVGSESAKKKPSHADHKHSHPKEEGKKGGHSHGDLNMRGVFLHVMGDALGNIGVIGSALIIWLTNYSWRFYADPVISLIITVIILCSAIPLCKAASRILLQAVPAGLSIDDIKDDISELDGIISCHHLHVWQLSDTKLIASLHVQVGFDFKGEGAARYMALAREIRKCLHEYGIHSSTIQPEFCLDANHDHSGGNSAAEETCSQEPHAPSSSGSTPRPSNRGSKANSVQGDEEACLLACGDDCGNGKQCCTTEVQGCTGGK
jgi:zinc transporter 1